MPLVPHFDRLVRQVEANSDGRIARTNARAASDPVAELTRPVRAERRYEIRLGIASATHPPRPDPLEDSELRLKWANKNIKKADVLVHNYCQARPWTVELDRQTEPGKKIARLRFTQEIPDEAVELVHSIVSQLRGALDSLAWAVAARHGPPLKPDQVRFPIYNSRQDFESAGAQRQIKELGADWLAFIVGLSPYPGGADLLVALSSIHNTDKHRRLTRTKGVNAAGGFEAGNITSGQVSFDVTFLVGSLDDGQMIVTVGEQDPDPKIDFTLKVAFAAEPGKVADKRPVIEMLRQFAGAVENVVQLGRRTFF